MDSRSRSLKKRRATLSGSKAFCIFYEEAEGAREGGGVSAIIFSLKGRLKIYGSPDVVLGRLQSKNWRQRRRRGWRGRAEGGHVRKRGTINVIYIVLHRFSWGKRRRTSREPPPRLGCRNIKNSRFAPLSFASAVTLQDYVIIPAGIQADSPLLITRKANTFYIFRPFYSEMQIRGGRLLIKKKLGAKGRRRIHLKIT